MLTFVYIFYLLVKAIMNSSFKVFTNIYRGWGKSMMVGVRDKVGRAGRGLTLIAILLPV